MVSIGSGNDLLPDDAKQIPQSLLIDHFCEAHLVYLMTFPQ